MIQKILGAFARLGSEDMRYGEVVHGRLCRRVNRFIAEVLINGIKEQVHIKNTGRLIELLQPNTEVLLELSDNPSRDSLNHSDRGKWKKRDRV